MAQNEPVPYMEGPQKYANQAEVAHKATQLAEDAGKKKYGRICRLSSRKSCKH